MKSFHIFSLTLMIASIVATLNALAVPMKVHMLDNLSPHELSLAQKIINQKGYLVSNNPIFKDSKEVVVITKNMGLDGERPSIQLEVVRQNDPRKIPKSVFNKVIETSDIEKALEKLPEPEKLKNSAQDSDESNSVALQN